MGTIVTIGGGTDVFGSAPAIEKKLVAMTRKAKPRVLYYQPQALMVLNILRRLHNDLKHLVVMWMF